MTFNQYYLRTALPNANFKFINKNKITGFAVDNRQIKPNEIFIALVGKQIDGHSFIESALDVGAGGIVINKDKQDYLKKIPKQKLKDKLIIVVNDTLEALYQLAKVWRQRFCYPVVAITGSVGKTTTKEIVANILRVANFDAVISLKNQNATIGLCLNILRMREYHKAAVFEVGISLTGEMELNINILRPDIGLITCVAHSHSNELGTLYQIVEQKRKIFKYFHANNIGIIFGDQKLLDDYVYHYPVIRFGLKRKNVVRARNVVIDCTPTLTGGATLSSAAYAGLRNKASGGKPFALSEVPEPRACRRGEGTKSNGYERESFPQTHLTFTLQLFKQTKKIKLNTTHSGLVNNSLAAATIAHLLNISFKDIVEGVESYTSFENRFEKRVLKNNKGVVISDCYNANPVSMKAAIQAFEYMKSGGEKIAILGDMLSLGNREAFWHRHIGRFLKKTTSIKKLILVGERAKLIAQTAPVFLEVEFASNWQEAKDKVEQILRKQTTLEPLILVKASRDVGLRELVKELCL
jgi:UDP-N-acetylmuramoyl-tripeptide--D-alanyl-D-alanine ligase